MVWIKNGICLKMQMKIFYSVKICSLYCILYSRIISVLCLFFYPRSPTMNHLTHFFGIAISLFLILIFVSFLGRKKGKNDLCNQYEYLKIVLVFLKQLELWNGSCVTGCIMTNVPVFCTQIT